MKIITTPQLDFHNVLIRPKRTTISSRSQVNLEREMTFPHSTMTWKGTTYHCCKYGYYWDI